MSNLDVMISLVIEMRRQYEKILEAREAEKACLEYAYAENLLRTVESIAYLYNHPNEVDFPRLVFEGICSAEIVVGLEQFKEQIYKPEREEYWCETRKMIETLKKKYPEG